MKPFAFILRPGETIPLANLMTWIASRDVTKTWQVIVSEHKANKSDAQNRLQWMWHGEWAKKYGYTKDHAYNRFKLKYCLPILLAKPANEQLRRVWELVRNDKEAIAGLIKALHTSDLEVPEMAEALTEYDRHTAVHGLAFTDPAELKMEAFGK